MIIGRHNDIIETIYLFHEVNKFNIPYTQLEHIFINVINIHNINYFNV